ncbi:hypothetical protein OEW28_08820 [Defluviimonas sp. WL0002]|uniref:Uncharacterized protein n=1 Tax=Albidovulum marisflavi TaxID=2984159 RepID=A0ABT2ZCB9_9RHOB|nr:hypothetical protein [Defluviimonas sp. WL0002]MCV2868728.1 hypothetical protein [Defluviimonas sp. WL0002]
MAEDRLHVLCGEGRAFIALAAGLAQAQPAEVDPQGVVEALGPGLVQNLAEIVEVAVDRRDRQAAVLIGKGLGVLQDLRASSRERPWVIIVSKWE